jgi:nucleotide-binding universal stress UspA family protein
MQTILVGYDDSETAGRALERAATLAKALGATLIVTSVAPITETTGGRSLGADPIESPAKHLSELHTAHVYLDGQGLTATYIEAVGHEGGALVAAAADQGADLVVVGATHVSAIGRMFGGSVPDTVAHHARCDVLIVR